MIKVNFNIVTFKSKGKILYNKHELVKIQTISIDETNQRLDNFLKLRFKRIPKSRIYSMIRKGEVRINKKRVKPKYKLKLNDILRIPPIKILENKPKIYLNKFPKLISLVNTVLYEDEYIMAIDKPSGTAVHGGSGINWGIIEWLRSVNSNKNFFELVHRLDLDTSGVLLIAKKKSVLRHLHEQFRLRQIKKNYLALVRGKLINYKKIVAPLFTNILSSGERIVKVTSYGKPSVTLFKVKEHFNLATLVNIFPITGRTHQIRVHAQYAGHPIALDTKYGDKFFNQKFKSVGLHRLFLHATSVCFIHPNNGKLIKIVSPLNEQLLNCLIYLRSTKNTH